MKKSDYLNYLERHTRYCFAENKDSMDQLNETITVLVDTREMTPVGLSSFLADLHIIEGYLLSQKVRLEYLLDIMGMVDPKGLTS